MTSDEVKMHVRAAAKSAAFWLATVAASPALVSFWVRAALFGRDRALEGSTQALALLPGLFGQNVRRAFLVRALDSCDRSATIEFGTIFSSAGARIDAYAYIGPHCHLGLVHIERDVLIAGGVHIPSGPDTHGIVDLTTPIREQAGRRRMVRIGAGSWIGSAAIVMADVGRDTVVGAGSVVTRPLPDRALAAGVPAKTIRFRDAAERESA
jgi:acetyltransferase-like isoleucine patch superfamily enzyme